MFKKFKGVKKSLKKRIINNIINTSFKQESEKDLNEDSALNKTFIIKNKTDFLNESIINTNDSNYSLNIKICDYSNKKNESINFEIKEDLKIIIYSKTPRKKYNNMIYQYFYDKFSKNEEKNAYIILFIGKKGDGKSSSINSFFNIIKGIKIENDYRYILIEESDKLEKGLHLYYIKDSNNKPFIIINCQGYGDIKSKELDDDINNAFINIFKYLIPHINLICFIGKETSEKLDFFSRYIFSITTSLFTEEFLENFIILVTHSTNQKERSYFINLLKEDINFDDIKYKLKEKWKYFIDNKSIFNENINNKLGSYSFNELYDIYNQKILNSKKISTKNCIKIINYRNEIISLVKNIISYFQNIKSEDKKIPSHENQINYYNTKISTKNSEIRNYELKISNCNKRIDNYNLDLSNLEKTHNNKINELNNQYETIKLHVLESSYSEHTYCTSCERNCHEYCTCIGSLVDRCTVFPIFGNDCEKCGHSKSYHRLHSNYRYVDKYERKKINNYNKINDENNIYYKKRSEINNKIMNTKFEKDRYGDKKNYLINDKKSMESSKNYYLNEKKNCENNIKYYSNYIYSCINKLIDIENDIKENAMNKFHVSIENKYIDTLIKEMKKINYNNDNIRKLKEKRDNFVIYQELTTNYIYLLGFKLCSKK